MMKRASADASWWQSPEMRPYLVKSIARFNEARVCSADGDEIEACGMIRDGLYVLQAGLGACSDPDGVADWLRSALLDELVGSGDRAVQGVDFPFLWGVVEWLFDYPVNRRRNLPLILQDNYHRHVFITWSPAKIGNLRSRFFYERMA